MSEGTSVKVGFVGLGTMGSRMAKNIVDAGFELIVWNRTSTKAEAFAKKHSCKSAKSPKSLVEQSDVVFTMLADDESSEEVHSGEHGLLTTKDGAKIFIEMGTLSPNHIFDLVQEAQNVEKRIIDSPVSGSTKSAETATLMIMFGGDQETYNSLKSIYDVMSNHVIVLDNLSAASIMKLVVNSLIHGMNQTLSEALVLAEKAGIPVEKAYEVIENSAAAAPMFHYRKDLYLDDKKHPVSFALKLAKKDLDLILGLGHECGVFMNQATLNFKSLVDAVEAGYGERDMASLVDYIRKEHKQ